MIPALKGTRHGNVADDTPLHLLSESIVQLFLRGVRDEEQFRLLARILVTELIRVFGADHPLPAPPALRKALAMAESGLRSPLSVEELARKAERSKSGITELFRRHCGTSPIQWLNRRRIERARELLATSALPVGEIGAEVGIEDPFYFSRLFKKMTGQSPLTYRKQARRF